MYINSTKLSKLGQYTKILINEGTYKLFSLPEKTDNYLLRKTKTEYILLGSNGEVVDKSFNTEEINIGEYIYFDDFGTAPTGLQLNLL